MKKKSGFKYKITGLKSEWHTRLMDQTINIYFKSFNEKIVKCWIKDNAVDKSFIGISKCNTQAGDVFDTDTGMGISLTRALKKREEHYNKIFKKFQKVHDSVNLITNTKIVIKFQNLLDKEKISC